MFAISDSTREALQKMDYLTRVRILSAVVGGANNIGENEALIVAEILMVRNENPRYIPAELDPTQWKNAL